MAIFLVGAVCTLVGCLIGAVVQFAMSEAASEFPERDRNYYKDKYCEYVALYHKERNKAIHLECLISEYPDSEPALKLEDLKQQAKENRIIEELGL